MDFALHYTPMQEEFRKEVRKWIKDNVPDNMRMSVDERVDPTPEQAAFWKVKHQELAKKGWLHPTYPTKYGGGGLTAEHETVLLEEFQRARVPQHHADVETISTLLVWGTEAQ